MWSLRLRMMKCWTYCLIWTQTTSYDRTDGRNQPFISISCQRAVVSRSIPASAKSTANLPLNDKSTCRNTPSFPHLEGRTDSSKAPLSSTVKDRMNTQESFIELSDHDQKLTLYRIPYTSLWESDEVKKYIGFVNVNDLKRMVIEIKAKVDSISIR